MLTGLLHRPRSLTSWLLRACASTGCAAGGCTRGLGRRHSVLCVGNYTSRRRQDATVLALTKLLRDLGETPVVLSRVWRTIARSDQGRPERTTPPMSATSR